MLYPHGFLSLNIYFNDLGHPNADYRPLNLSCYVNQEPEFLFKSHFNILLWTTCELWTFFSFNYFLFSETFDILVSTGYPLDSATKTTEIINIDDDSSTCKDLGEYPLKIQGAVGFNMGSMPVICGGRLDGLTYSNQCHRMESGIWKPFANLAQGYVLY